MIRWYTKEILTKFSICYKQLKLEANLLTKRSYKCISDSNVAADWEFNCAEPSGKPLEQYRYGMPSDNDDGKQV